MTWEIFAAIMTMPLDDLDRRLNLVRHLLEQYYGDVEQEYDHLLRRAAHKLAPRRHPAPRTV